MASGGGETVEGMETKMERAKKENELKKYNLNMIYVSGPGHGGNAITSNTYLEGSYSEIYPNITYDEEGLKKLFKQFFYYSFKK